MLLHGPLPLIIGITGHRDLPVEDIPILRQAIESIFLELRQKYSSTPLCLISSLAEGADCLVAEVALAMQISLIVALPFPQSVYEMDFETDTVKDVFRKLLSSATQVYEVPLAEGLTASSVAVYGTDRNQQYLAAGKFVVSHSQILLALWDGVFNMKTGGTGEIVQLQLDGEIDLNSRAEDQHQIQTGAVCHVMTRRISSIEKITDKKNSNGCGEVKWLYPVSLETGGTLYEEQHRLLGCIEAFNQDCILLPKTCAESSESELISADGLSPACLQIQQQFGWADGLAQRYQRKTIRAFLRIAICASFSVFCFEIFSNAWAGLPIIASYLAALVAAYGVFTWSEKYHHHRKYLDYRALAEGLRVQFFWKMAGMNDSVAKYYLCRQESELDWIRHALRTVDFWCRKDIEDTQVMLSEVKKSWVDAQAGYYEKAVKRDSLKLQRLQKKTKRLVQLGMWVITPAMLVIHGFVLGGELLDQWMQVITPSIFVVAGALNYYVEKMQFESHIKQYRRMNALFKRYALLWELNPMERDRNEYQQNLLRELGKAALAENSDWVLTHRQQPLEVPQG